MRIISFELDEPMIERILARIGEPTWPPQGEFRSDQGITTADRPETA